MKKLVLRLFLILLLAAVGLGIALEFIPLPDATPRVEALPTEGEDLVATDLPLDDAEKSFFGTTRILKREYRTPKHRFLLFVIDLSSDPLSVHDPLFFFRGTGWDVRSPRRVAVPGGEAVLADLWRSTSSSEAVVWFSDGRIRHASGQRQWLQSILRRVTLGRSGEEPVLVMLQPVPGTPVQWTDLFHDFPPLFRL